MAIDCEAVADDGFRRLGGRTLDLSVDGMLIETSGAYARVGEEIFVAFRAPRSSLWVDAVARVARVLRGRRRGDRQGVGLEIVSMDPVDRAILGARLRGHPPPVPRRPRPIDYAAYVRAIADV